MKSIKIFSVCLAAVLGLSSCASSWLDQELTGSTLTQEEYNSMSDVAVGTVKGIYAAMYAYGSGHDEFGQKCIDLGSDLVSSDLAMTAQAYGWFVTDAQRLTAYRTSYIWSYYYGMIMNANAVMRSLDKKSTMTAEEQGAYAQALAIRGFCYYSLANYYGPASADITTPSVYGRKGKHLDFDLAPIYTQNDTTEAGLVRERPLSTYKEVREFANQDLSKAIEMFEECGYARSSKLFFDGTLTRAIYAYNNLQFAAMYEAVDMAKAEEYYQNAYENAVEIIESGEYEILPRADVLTTGFTDVNNNSWMWGLDVTMENSTGLATFWGHMDIYTYSYAYAGATKGCDQLLMDEFKALSPNDIRIQWFDSTQKYIPNGKFYDHDGKKSVLAGGTDIDRDWRNDDVFMRIEEMYLIAAEAACGLSNAASAKYYMNELLCERTNFANDDAINAALTTQWVESWSNSDLIKQIYYNWRIELFAEGRALITFKRFDKNGAEYSQKKRGSNHFSQSGNDMKAEDYAILYIMPSSESSYNNEIND